MGVAGSAGPGGYVARGWIFDRTIHHLGLRQGTSEITIEQEERRSHSRHQERKAAFQQSRAGSEGGKEERQERHEEHRHHDQAFSVHGLLPPSPGIGSLLSSRVPRSLLVEGYLPALSFFS